MRLTDFDVLTFDMIGTLIDFERGILDWMRPRILRVHPEITDTTILEPYARAQSAVRKAEPEPEELRPMTVPSDAPSASTPATPTPTTTSGTRRRPSAPAVSSERALCKVQ